MRLPESLDTTIETNVNYLTDLTRQLILYKTVTPELEENPKTGGNEDFGREDFILCQEFIADTVRRLGGMTEMWDITPDSMNEVPGCDLNKTRDYTGMPVMAARIPGTGGGKSLILNGHYDVVQPGDPSRWTHGPFEAVQKNGRIIGRGTCDMKGGIAAMLTAVKAIRESGIRLKGDLIIETVPEEEATSMGTLSCCQKGYTADAAVIPEPTNMNVLIAVRGVWSGRITVPGRAGHAEITQPHWRDGGAVNAIMKAMYVLNELDKLNTTWQEDPERQHPHLDPEMVIPTIINGGNYITNYPESVVIGLESMSLPGNLRKHEELEECLNEICAKDPWLKENPVKIERSTRLYSAEVKEDEPIAALGMKTLLNYNHQAQFVGMGSLTDAIHLINHSHIPTISVGPSDQGAHQTDESVAVQDLVTTAKVIAGIIIEWCGVV